VDEDEAFLAAIRQQPADNTVRLVYADWLDERDDPRGELLRIECLLHQGSEADADHTLRQRLSELGGRVDVRWLAAVCRVPVEIGLPHQHPSRCPLNVPGPFYTCGSCLACEAPEDQAPDLLAPLGQGNYTTYFVHQPRTAEEVERACGAARVCCLSDLRYGGTDPRIIARLGNDPEFCDNLLADDSARLVPAPPRWREQTR
jgi:uncharacterized protein (TIGR02996 family)